MGVESSLPGRAEYLRYIKSVWSSRVSLIREEHSLGKKTGFASVHRLSALTDLLLVFLFERAYVDSGVVFEDVMRNLALLAIGGYGRKELSPHSDIDILFLVKCGRGKSVEKVVESVLYYLWDMGFDVGHCYRTIPECLKEMKDDISTYTSLIESRRILGSKILYSEFLEALDGYTSKRRTKEFFIKSKLEEKTARYALYGWSTTLLEPNIKESPGGLRDYHLSLWLARAQFGTKNIKAMKELFSVEEWREYYTAVSTLLQIRAELHFLKKKKADMVYMGDWITLAGRLRNLCETDTLNGTKCLMKNYYRSARSIRYYSNLIVKKCCSEPTRIRAKTPSAILLEGCIYMRDSEITLENADEDLFAMEPSTILKVFYYSQKCTAFIGAKLWREIKIFLKNGQAYITNDEACIKLFISILERENAHKTISAMHSIGLLNHIIPEFKEIDCLSQFDPFHQYTVDEHCLKALQYLEELKNSDKAELKTFINVYQEFSGSVTLKLAALLHDIGKGRHHDHDLVSGKLVLHTAQRLKLCQEEVQNLTFLVKNHLLMNNIAQHHDLHDEKVLSDFSFKVGTQKRLKMLMLLTYCDLKAVGKATWTTWKGSLILELFRRTMQNMSDADFKSELPHPSSGYRQILQSLKGEFDECEISAHIEGLPKAHFDFISREKLRQELRAVHRLSEEDVVLFHSRNEQMGCSEFTVCMLASHPGLFSEITGVILSHKLNILGANIFTRADGVVVDVIQTEAVSLDDEQEVLESVKKMFYKVWNKEISIQSLVSKRRRFVSQKRVEPLETKMEIDNATSAQHTILQITTWDRLGLIYIISSAIFHLGVDIVTAKIVTEGNRVIDTFYLSSNDSKITDKYMLESICMILKNAVDSCSYM